MAQNTKEALNFRLDGVYAKLETTPQVAFRVMQALKASSHGVQILDRGEYVDIGPRKRKSKKVA